MSTFFSYARTCLILVLIVTTATIAVPYDNALAGGALTGGYSEITGQQALTQQRISAVQGTVTAANTSATALATGQLFVKENLLDGIAWAVAKQMVSNMTRSLINWINSGFQGSPSFVTDFKQMLLDSLDQVAGEYIKSLGGIGEFICSPFQLDVQAALAINYAQARSGNPSGPNENLCTLTGIASNIENFLSGTADSWGQWMEVTANPQNTPYGAYLAAEASLNVRLRNEAGQEIEVASWGDGFLSNKVCQAIEGTTQEECKITTPGQVVSEALTFQLSTGPRSLIEADEINELIGALLNQLVLQAVQGLNGLLGLSETGSNGTSYLDDVVNEGINNIDYTPYKKEMDAAFDREVDMLILIDKALAAAASNTATSTVIKSNSIDIMARVLANMAQLNAYIDKVLSTSTNNGALTNNEKLALLDASTILDRVSANVTELAVLINRYEGATTTAQANLASSTASTTPNNQKLRAEINRIRQDIVLDYLTLKSSGNLTTDALIKQKRQEWQALIYPQGGGQL
ncbi:MAG: hypothetical protein RLZZ360_700 [Candidatus Parcubacteria bacterium]|jgi:hypothetical protein